MGHFRLQRIKAVATILDQEFFDKSVESAAFLFLAQSPH
jgi:hypothetical protein